MTAEEKGDDMPDLNSSSGNDNYLLIIDGSGLLSTHYFGNLPREILFSKTKEEKERYYDRIMQTKNGVYTNAVFGFLRALFKILKEQKPGYLAVMWDLTRDTFRREKYPEYKANRDETPLPLITQFDLCQKILQRIGVRQFMSETYEADDYAGTIAKRFENEVPVRILTKDRDYLQLVNEKTHLWMLLSAEEKKDELFRKYRLSKETLNIPDKTIDLDPERVLGEYEVTPEMVTSLKGLEGDPSDHIPGVPGVGHQTAVKLVRAYGSVEALYETLHRDLAENEAKIKAYWKNDLGITRPPFTALMRPSEDGLYGEDAARLSKELATIVTDVPVGNVSLSDMTVKIDWEEAEEVLRELEIRSFDLSAFRETAPEPAFETPAVTEDYESAEAFVEKLKAESVVGVLYDKEIGLALSGEKAGVLVMKPFFLLNEASFASFLKALDREHVTIASFGGKAVYALSGVLIKDLGIAAYLLNPLEGNPEPKSIVSTYLNRTLPEKEDAESFIASSAVSARLSYPVLKEKLKALSMEDLYETIEIPTMAALYDMEKAGIYVEKEELNRFSGVLEKEIGRLTEEIHDLAGEPFNINSPKQLGSILFEKLAIPYGRKPKTGYSTAVDVLERFREDYPIVGKVLQYRTYAKLKSTYADALSAFIREDGRIHGTFHQTVTATGRISSSNPNLQNIPVRTELGQEFRKMFVPKPGCLFVDADYSQIELRVLASLSEDENLIKAFTSGTDVHTLTASEVFHEKPENVTAEERRKAKAVNFGIVYGISAYSLSEDIHVSVSEAEAYMQRYFETYPGVKAYLDRTVSEAQETGMVKTMFGRIRPVPEIRSSNHNVRSFGER
ncbi:MAG: DNA polymerase I, partial [Lachnospiraceae bacterium]|nr:DNA polymerase I [Lachnospiraceae bacterium]